LGIASLTPVGVNAALFGNIAHGLITGLLFFLAGAVKDRAHTGSLTDLGGLRENAPALSGLLGYAAIASLGLPGLAGFATSSLSISRGREKLSRCAPIRAISSCEILCGRCSCRTLAPMQL
jgi:NADH-quinone oxidoreductase subunit M